ncbi:MAG: cation transporter [Chitinophagaceae bacterium]|jgi:copper chaperone CopZ|nr:cation transporter [Chitinophagaceae bacterium]MBK7679639.1 cation transporter [Chitinophagaceae bacterium]MBK8299008.1 cation transporter [Chitinophagaceae bacterium]MBK9464830.1 cation transporter [Chitinophagaceae bacterium]MBK9659810.1 cation transporter [Chitinophagaceae bacterium]
MKPFLISALAIIISTASFSQVKPIRVDTIKTPNALCENCKKRIEAYVKPYDGILEITVNYRKAETKVKYLTDRINIEEIKAYIANCGYDAGDVPAAEDAYERLPKTCKKFEDGGGHPKPKVPVPAQ